MKGRMTEAADYLQERATAETWGKGVVLMATKTIIAGEYMDVEVYPLVAVVLVKLIGGDLMMATMAVVAFSGPSGMNVVVVPASYGRDCRTGASIVMLSSLCAVLTVPILYALLQLLFP